ncbi:MAG: hypothetical protein E6J34_16430 [Chloroflexi bacterium]|nr:MAG: hypothetical protein E6J34_16430 [Chloroflexota bacterium]
MTERDLHGIEWIAEQEAMRLDQLQQLLSRYMDARHPFKNGKLLAETTVRGVVARWVRAGWVRYKQIYAYDPGWVCVTGEGLVFVDREQWSARPASMSRLDHLYAV